MATSSKTIQRDRRHRRIRARVVGSAEKPRLAVYRSNRSISVQLIDDVAAKTLASATSSGMKGTERDNAVTVGQEIAKKAKSLGITKIVFDRGGFLYAGKIKALADAAREGGLTF